MLNDVVVVVDGVAEGVVEGVAESDPVVDVLTVFVALLESLLEKDGLMVAVADSVSLLVVEGVDVGVPVRVGGGT